jgi:crotonobetaine/carnitine-CoA ligase
MIQFTSGSSGVSKAVQLSHGYLEGQGSGFSEVFDLGETDVLYCPFPLYHWDATVGNEAMSPLFQAVIEATEEAIYNSLLSVVPSDREFVN